MPHEEAGHRTIQIPTQRDKRDTCLWNSVSQRRHAGCQGPDERGLPRDPLSYIKSKLKKSHKNAYVNAMVLQNVYLTKANTVVILQIMRRMMEQLWPKLLTAMAMDYISATCETYFIG
jgi:hypothetical protein